MGYISLKDLTLTQQHAKIKIRVSRIWESTTPQLKKDILSLDCLLIDEEGYAMQATIRKHDATTFRALLSEGNAYIIENFNVIPSRNTYKVVDRRYMIQISKWTRIVEAKEDVTQIPFHNFYFLSFDYIRNKKYADGCLIDVIGNIVATGTISYTYVGQERTAIRKLQIGNLE
uniref:Replication protein A 70 kDa DNA-binding subunit B/D first OB fold domain-containing protein n=1 Tax=Ananas comosus var. bracteatus TaxID=296719 RepID=A0A6V7NJB8_ANACO|nr:unnamed protein product [Ananas comosus var. bracteatus]